LFLQLQNIRFSFPGKKGLINNVSIDLEKGKIYVLMGTNGSGKTTLFNLITGFHKPLKGKIYFKGNDITKLPPHKINQSGIGRTFQDLRLITKLSVRDNILLAMKGDPTNAWYKALLPQSFYRNEIKVLEEKADVIIQEYFLADVKKSFAGEISFGQQKLLTLACCTANDPQCLLLDEPVAGIQPEYQHKVVEKLKKLKQEGKTIFFIDHNTEFIEDISDRLFFLHEGSISIFDDVKSMRTDKHVMEAYL